MMKRSRPSTLEPISAAMLVMVSLHLALVLAGWWWWHRNKQVVQSPTLTWLNTSDFQSTVAPDPQPPVSPKASSPKASSKPVVSKPAATEAKQASEAPVQKATLVSAPPQQHQMVPTPNDTTTPLFASSTPPARPAANRSITLRRAPEKRTMTASGNPAPPVTSPSLLDIARLNTLRPPPIPRPGAPGATPAEEINMDRVDEAVNTAFLAAWNAPSIDSVPAAQREARLNLSIGPDGSVLKAQMSKFSGSHALDESIINAASQVKKISAALPSNFAKDSYDLELNFLLLP